MTVTFAQVARTKTDNLNVVITNVTLDATYPAGGEAITANQLGLSTVSQLMVMSHPAGAVFWWDQANLKLKAFYADYSTTTDGLLIEIAVGDTAILDGVVVPVMAVGI